MTMKRSAFYLPLLLGLLFAGPAAAQIVSRMEPGNWWTGMKTDRIEVMFQGERIADAQVSLDAPASEILAVTRTDNPNYLFVEICIGEEQRPGTLRFDFRQGRRRQQVGFPLCERDTLRTLHRGYDTSDVIYLLMPDRFVDGDPSNNTVEGMADRLDRSAPNGRHGGDLQGMIDKLDYLAALGVTAVWSTPLWEMNHDKGSYHGYAATDFYRIDARYGSNELYRRFVAEAHKRGIKVLIDLVPNHCSISHPWLTDLPAADWVHPQTSGRTLAIPAWTDPHASESDYRLNKDGWFTRFMPDLNQSNPHLLRYLTQNAIWWVEYAGLDAIRVDTYPYCERDEAAKWTRAIREEYPAINIVGECWQNHPATVAYWQTGARNFDGYDSQLPSVMDFPLMDAMHEAFGGGRSRGVNKLYNILSQDYLYPDPQALLVFADNHDTQRIASAVGRDPDLYKAALGFLLTTRGTPQLYYGSEVMLDSEKEGIYTDNANRKKIEGSWPGDPRDAFTRAGRTELENDIFDYVSALLNWRKGSQAVCYGTLRHFKPRGNSYVYFRCTEQERVLVGVNLSDRPEPLDCQRFAEMLDGYRTGTDVVTGESYPELGRIILRPKSTTIIELKK